MVVNVDSDLARIVETLDAKMKERGFNQIAVQRELGWRGSYISQLFSRTKRLRVDQVLQILAVINVNPSDFFSEVFPLENEEENELLVRMRDGLRASCDLIDLQLSRAGEPGIGDRRP